MKNRNVLITGANSFIGSYFRKSNKNLNIREVCLLENKPDAIDFFNVETVFHVAAIVHQDKDISEDIYYKVNSDLAFEVALKAKQSGVKQFVFMSTIKVYGENSTEEVPWTEESECLPTDSYGKSKLDAEKRLMELQDESFVVSIVRTPVVYGAGVKGNIQKIARFVELSVIVPFKGIENKRAMVFIGNLTALIREIVLQKKGGVFLAGDNNILSLSEFVGLLIKTANKQKLFISFPKVFQWGIKILRPNIYSRLFGSMVIDNSKTKKSLNFKPPFSIEEGIKEIICSVR